MPRHAARPGQNAQNAVIRHDPPPRHMNGFTPFGTVVNPNPNKKYVLAYVASAEQGPAYYESIGYHRVNFTNKSSTHMSGGDVARQGDACTYRGHLLMEIDLELWKQIEMYGLDGRSGLAMHDKRMSEILSEDNGREDLFRGVRRHSPGRRMAADDIDQWRQENGRDFPTVNTSSDLVPDNVSRPMAQEG